MSKKPRDGAHRTSSAKKRTIAPPLTRERRSDAERQSLTSILNLIRTSASCTRQDIEHLSGLGRAVVADRLATLSKLGLSHESALGRPTGGRAPRLVQFRADAGVILVAVLDAASIGIGVANLSGQLLIEHHEAADLAAGPVSAIKRLCTLFDWVLEQHQGDHEVWGIGISVPGPVENSNGRQPGPTRLHFLPNWDEYPLTAALAERYRAPVTIRNRVQMRTLGELRAGSAVGADNFLFVDLGTEISGGIVSNGRLHLGALGAAGLIGHVAAGDGNSGICRCGNAGCLEVTAGSEAIAREATRAAREGQSAPLAEALKMGGGLSVAEIGLAAQRGDAFSAELLARCGRQIGAVLAGLANAFNPSLIVLGGEVADTGDILLAAIREAIYGLSHPLVTRDLRIVRSQMGSSAGLMGSALTMIDEIFAPDFMVNWVALGSPRKHPSIDSMAGLGANAAVPRARTAAPPTENALPTNTAARSGNRR